MADSVPTKFSPRRFILDRMIGFVVAVVFFLASLAAYTTYKYFTWSHVQAVVVSVEPICVYAKKIGRRSVMKEYLSCDADSEATAAGLIADGYKLRPDREALVTAAYEISPGRQISATLRPWWNDVATVSPGSVIQIRFSPFSPLEPELVTGAAKLVAVILGFFLGALLLACLIGVLTYEGDERATSA